MSARRWLAVSALLPAVVLAGCATTANPTPGAPPAPRIVPWAALPVLAAVAPTPLPIPRATKQCTARQLEVRYLANGAFTGGQISSGFEFVDRSAKGCQLGGTPTVQLFTGAGQAIALQPGPNPLGPSPSGPVLLLPGLTAVAPDESPPGVASLAMVWPELDLAAGGTDCSPPAATASSVTFSLPGRAGQVSVELPTSGPRLAAIAPCNGAVWVSPFQATIPNSSANLPRLRARIVAPGTVMAGHVLRYRVVLTDSSKVALDFANGCAGYGEAMSGKPGSGVILKVVKQYELNCARAGTLEPGKSISFAMALGVPLGTAHAAADLTWELDPSNSFGAPAARAATVHVT
ncbi:MAG: hypothetical protein WA809_10215 [Candidatus Dormiibacterota bacterium]